MTMQAGWNDAASRPQTRGQSDHHRRRLLQILERESSGDATGCLRSSKSLPSLPLQPQPLLLGSCPSPVLTKCTPNLSPLRTQRQRPVTRLTVRTARRPMDVVNQDDVTLPPDTAHDQIEAEAALAQKAEDWDKRRARMLAKQYKAAQLEQIHDKQQQRRERSVDAQQIAEQIAWEHTQLDLVDQARRHAKRRQLLELRESELHSLELDRRQAGAAKITQHFFDQLTVMDPAQAMVLFVAKQDELVACCLELMAECVERHDLDQFKGMLHETLQKQELLLRHRLRAAQREEDVKAAKKKAVVDLKRAHYDEIQRHLSVTREGKADERRLRQELQKQQQIQDMRYQALQDRKKQRDLDLSAKLQEQTRRHRAECATVSLQIEGKTSPTLRTPFWIDETTEARLDTYERQAQTAASPPRPTIFAKKTCQWYD